MKKTAQLGILVGLAASALTLGCSPPGAITASSAPLDASNDATVRRSFRIDPGSFAEANFTMKRGSTFTVTFSQGASDLAWDVHSHDHGGGTQIHRRGTGGSGTVEFEAYADGVFCVLWMNDHDTPSALDVSAALSPGAGLHSCRSNPRKLSGIHLR